MNPVYKSFRKEDIGKLYEAFVKAFSEYYVNFNPSAEQFRNRIFHKLNVAPNLSGLVWEGDDVVGFILHTLHEYHGLPTVYNGGTGVIPERRKEKLMTRLYEKLSPEIIACGAKRILLEVVDNNKSAIRFYESLDFHYTRTFHCFKTYKTFTPLNSYRIENSPVLKQKYKEFCDFEPSFLDSFGQLQYNMQKEFILEAYMDELLVGFIIFQPVLGRISQVAVHKSHRGKSIGRELLAHAQAKSLNKRLTIMNVPGDEIESINSLIRLGFTNEINQFEMELII